MPDDAPKLFEEKLWHEKTMYQCLQCPWSTLDKAEMQTHLAIHASYARGRKPRQVDTGLYGPSGGKIVREEVVEPEEEKWPDLDEATEVAGDEEDPAEIDAT